MRADSGVTLIDLIIALAVITLFVGLISGLFYSSFKINLQSKISGAGIYYAMEILEDIDKIPYEEVQNGMESSYRDKFSIPTSFNLKIDVSNYNEGNDRDDVIKNVNLTITYEYAGESETTVSKKLKVKEL